MLLMLLLADAETVPRRTKLEPGELLMVALPLIGLLLVAALVLFFVDRWRKRRTVVDSDACAPNDQLSHFRSLYERGEMSREEYESVRALLAGQLRKELNVPAPPAAVTAHPAEAPPSDAIVPAPPPDRQSPPGPEAPSS
jgi:hypothetical protein